MEISTLQNGCLTFTTTLRKKKLLKNLPKVIIIHIFIYLKFNYALNIFINGVYVLKKMQWPRDRNLSDAGAYVMINSKFLS